MASLHEIKPAHGSVKHKKRVGRGQGSGMGKTATRGGKGQTARSGYTAKRGFEGGQQPLQRRLPKVGFTTTIRKPYVINTDRINEIFTLSHITIESINAIHKLPGYIRNDKKQLQPSSQRILVKLIGSKASTLATKIQDSRIATSRLSQ